MEPHNSLVYVGICKREISFRCTGILDQEWEDTAAFDHFKAVFDHGNGILIIVLSSADKGTS